MAAYSDSIPRGENKVDLGFVEEVDSNSILSHQFPSKVGGKPAWLSLNPLPTTEQLMCLNCRDPLVFLLQVYAPRDESELTFHRTIFIFVCRKPTCCVANDNKNFKVFRSQLPKTNEFYSSTPPSEGPVTDPGSFPNASKYQPLCVICGAPGPKRCGKCKNVNYCSKQHQTTDWKAIHKTICTQNNESDGVNVMSFRYPQVLFPEFELVTEPEIYTKPQEKEEITKMKEYKEFLSSEAAKPISENLDLDELNQMAVKQNQDDEQFLKFKERTQHEPDQVLRFKRDGEPLWICASSKPEIIPPCICGSIRKFEFQVLPQLLCHLDVDTVGESLDWGVLCVYTCSKNCDIGAKYLEEFLWKQDLVKSSTDDPVS